MTDRQSPDEALRAVRDPDRLPAPGPACGDGVFETIRIHAGRLTLRAAHLERLHEGLQRLRLDPPAVFIDRLAAEADEQAERAQHGVLRIVVQAAAGEGAYQRRHPVSLQSFFQLRSAPLYPAEYYEAGIRARLCAQRLARQPQLAGIKHLNRLEQILAASEASPADCAEGLMLDTSDQLVEGIRSNVFLRLGENWCTPELSQCGVAGVMRAYLVEALNGAGTGVREAAVARTRMEEVSEMFVCNSVFGVWPVRRLDEYTFTVGGVTRQAQKLAAHALGLDG